MAFFDQLLASKPNTGIAVTTSDALATIPVGATPFGVAVAPDGGHVYVANLGSNTVSVIDANTGSVVRNPITFGLAPFGVAVAPDGSHVYVANSNSNTVSIIDV